MKLLVAVAIGGALGISVLPHLPAPHGRESPYFWLRREFTFHRQLDRLHAYRPPPEQRQWRFE